MSKFHYFTSKLFIYPDFFSNFLEFPGFFSLNCQIPDFPETLYIQNRSISYYHFKDRYCTIIFKEIFHTSYI